jgi:hypothetical protein
MGVVQTLVADVPLWDRVWPGTLFVLVGDILVLVGVIVAWVVYHRQIATANKQRQETSLAHLEGLVALFADRYDAFFGQSYVGKTLFERAAMEHKNVTDGTYGQVYQVPTESLVSLIQPAGDVWPFSAETVRAANVALSRITAFNQLVGQQTQFNALYGSDILTEQDSDRRPSRPSLALAAWRLTFDIHGAIGDSTWYADLKTQVTANIRDLKDLLHLNSPDADASRPLPPVLFQNAWVRPPWRVF